MSGFHLAPLKIPSLNKAASGPNVNKTPSPLHWRQLSKKQAHCASYWSNDDVIEGSLPSSPQTITVAGGYSQDSTGTLGDSFSDNHTSAQFDQLVRKYDLFEYSRQESPNQRSLDTFTRLYHIQRLHRAPTPYDRTNSQQNSIARSEKMSSEPENNVPLGEPVKGVCTIPARLSGCFSLGFQCLCWTLCVVIVSLFFCHIGGLSMIGSDLFHMKINRTYSRNTGVVITNFYSSSQASTLSPVTDDTINTVRRVRSPAKMNNDQLDAETFPTPIDFDTMPTIEADLNSTNGNNDQKEDDKNAQNDEMAFPNPEVNKNTKKYLCF